MIAGVDEAGRGALVGDVFAAAVILPDKLPESLAGLTDSKKLSEKHRNRLAKAIRECAVAWCVASVDAERIDQINILNATMEAMTAAVAGLTRLPEKVLIDGNRIPLQITLPAQAIVGGDALIPAISAASILAKTSRDAQMYALARQYPQYGFERHKGYGTRAHLTAIEQFGILPEHRQTFAPCRQGTLF